MDEMPIVRGVFLCEQVIVEAGTRRVSLINTFSRLEAAEFPAPAGRCVLYAVLVNGRGRIPLTVRVTSLADGAQQAVDTGAVVLTDPLLEYRLVVPFDDLVFPVPGRYEFELSAGGEVLGTTVVTVGRERGMP